MMSAQLAGIKLTPCESALAKPIYPSAAANTSIKPRRRRLAPPSTFSRFPHAGLHTEARWRGM